MEKLFSNGIRRETVPDNYIFPVGKRPGKLASKCKAIPVIDLGGGAELPEGNRHAIIELILKAGKEFGFFQVLNHGIPVEVSSNMMGAAKEFFEMPMEDKAPYFSEDPKKIPRLSTGNEHQTHGIKYWRDCLKVSCYPVEEFKHSWPEKPTEFRETLARYSVDARVLALRLLKLVSEGLGLKLDYFNGDLSGGRVIMNINYYAPCSDPTLTLGLPHHCDPNLITLLLQDDISGLEVFHEGEWIGVEPLENGVVVNIGHQLEVKTQDFVKLLISPAKRHSCCGAHICQLSCPAGPFLVLLERDFRAGQHSYFMFRQRSNGLGDTIERTQALRDFLLQILFC